MAKDIKYCLPVEKAMNRKMAATVLLMIMLFGTFCTVLVGTLKVAKADVVQSSSSKQRIS